MEELANEYVIEVKNVSKEFKKPVRQPGLWGMIKTLFSTKYTVTKAVDDISFSLKKGEIVGYIGANGAGKSTTIKMMCGILTPSTGEVLIDGYRPYKSKKRNEILRKIGVVFGQRTQLWWDLPLIESINLLKLIYNIDDDSFKERFEYLKSVLELEKFLNQPVRTLSLGQRMRADLAASLLHNPDILFLDEPTIGLDVLVKEKIITAIKEIHKKYQTTIILTTHDMNDISDLCQRIIIIDEGHLLFDGPFSAIKNRFGDIRHVSFAMKAEFDSETFMNHFDKLVTTNIVDGYLVVDFDAKIVKVNEVISYVFSHYEVADIKIQENSIESVVKRIYESKSY